MAMQRIITGCAAVLVLAVASPANASARGPSSGQVVRDWNDTARSQAFANPVALARILAIMHAAQHDAVNGAQPRYETYAATLHDRGADADAAAAAAAHEVLVAFFPANEKALDERLAASLSTVPDGRAEDAGVALGRAVGDVVLQARADDGYGVADPFTPAPAPGVWEPTPPAFAPMLEPQFQNVTPFTLRDRTQFLPDPQPSLTSRRYARDYTEVKLVGQDISPVRTADQTHVAHFWAEPSAAGWSRIANLVSAHYGYGLHRTARLQALLNMAMADGFVVGWYQKRHFAFWRPVTAIREGDTDGNPRTDPDPSWMSLRPTPALPDYPSTHSLLAARPRRSCADSPGRVVSRSAWSRRRRRRRGRRGAGSRSRRPNERTPSRACSSASTSASRSRPASTSDARSGGSRCGMHSGRTRVGASPPNRSRPSRVPPGSPT